MKMSMNSKSTEDSDCLPGSRSLVSSGKERKGKKVDENVNEILNED
jgi:hypothetical protein